MQSSRFPRSRVLVLAVLALGGGGCLGPNPLLTLQQQQAEDGSEAEAEAEAEAETGESEGDEGETGGSMSATDLPGTGGCEADAACMPEPLDGWQGPLHLYVGAIDALPPSCSGATPTTVAELFFDVDEHLSSETCACACGPLAGASCSDIILRRNDTLGCVAVSDTWSLAPSVCNNLGPQPTYHFSAPSSVVVGGACTASLVEPLSSASYTSRVVACGPPEPASACDDGVCLPASTPPFDGRVCIAAKGEVQCPAGPYTERSTYHEGLVDDRICASCSCAPPTDLPCTGKVQLSAEGCAGLLHGVIDVPGCSNNAIGSVEAARFAPDPIVGECEPSPAEIVGEVSPTSAWTFCCL
jgi:hypothetical protein